MPFLAGETKHCRSDETKKSCRCQEKADNSLLVCTGSFGKMRTNSQKNIRSITQYDRFFKGSIFKKG